MDGGLNKKYGLFTAISMVVGIVIGSGVFFKAQIVLQKTGGDVPLGIIAWIIGGLIMIACVLAFAMMAQKQVKINGVVDYAEAWVGKKYAYMIGWFISTIYYPSLTSVLAWVSARYTVVFLRSCWPSFPLVELGGELAGAESIVGPDTITIMMFYLIMAYVVNTLAPKIAGHFQTTTTVIKLIPIFLMAVVGVLVGLFGSNGLLVQNFVEGAIVEVDSSPLFAAVCSTAFAYDGWIVVTTINSELKNPKKTLPRALILGGVIIMAVYILYYVGVTGGASVEVLMNDGATVAFTNIFGGFLGNILNLFIAISCLGTMNGLMLGCTRSLYSISSRGEGPKHETFSQVDKMTNMPHNSALFALAASAMWGLYFYFSNLAGAWSGPFAFDSSEIPLVTIYAMYIPIFICWMIREKNEPPLKRFVIPALAIIGSAFMALACVLAHKMAVIWYLIIFAIIMVIGAIVNRKNEQRQKNTSEE